MSARLSFFRPTEAEVFRIRAEVEASLRLAAPTLSTNTSRLPKSLVGESNIVSSWPGRLLSWTRLELVGVAEVYKKSGVKLGPA